MHRAVTVLYNAPAQQKPINEFHIGPIYVHDAWYRKHTKRGLRPTVAPMFRMKRLKKTALCGE